MTFFPIGCISIAHLLIRGLSSSKLLIGLIERISECTASIVKILSGWLSDGIGRENLIVSGLLVYALVYLGFAYAAIKK